MPFDKGKKRKLIDNCGHERCYSCMFKNEQCPVCRQQQDYCDKKGNYLLIVFGFYLLGSINFFQCSKICLNLIILFLKKIYTEKLCVRITFCWL